jgi:hypothetical protein
VVHRTTGGFIYGGDCQKAYFCTIRTKNAGNAQQNARHECLFIRKYALSATFHSPLKQSTDSQGKIEYAECVEVEKGIDRPHSIVL